MALQADESSINLQSLMPSNEDSVPLEKIMDRIDDDKASSVHVSTISGQVTENKDDIQ